MFPAFPSVPACGSLSRYGAAKEADMGQLIPQDFPFETLKNDAERVVVDADRPAARTSTNAHTDAAYLLIDGSPHWVWVAEVDVEVINDIP